MVILFGVNRYFLFKVLKFWDYGMLLIYFFFSFFLWVLFICLVGVFLFLFSIGFLQVFFLVFMLDCLEGVFGLFNFVGIGGVFLGAFWFGSG